MVPEETAYIASLVPLCSSELYLSVVLRVPYRVNITTSFLFNIYTGGVLLIFVGGFPNLASLSGPLCVMI